MHHITQELTKCGFKGALDDNTITHTHGGCLDQLFAKNIDITNAMVNEGFDREITDHKCLKVSLSLNSLNTAAHPLTNQSSNRVFTHLDLKQGTLRRMTNAESTVKNMLATYNTIDKPAYEYFDRDEV
jgi:hypothetical protein